MEPGRQRLSQRRKAAALIQGLHAEGLGAQRSGAELFTVSQTTMTPPPAPRPSPPDIPARSGRSKRFPVAGVLAVVLAASAASALFVPSTSQPVTPGSVETPELTAPVAVIPASDPPSSTGNDPDADVAGQALPPPAGVGTASAATPALSGTPASAATPASKAHESQSDHPAPVRRKPAAPAVTAPSETGPTPVEAYDALSRAAGLSAGDQHWTRHRPESRR